MLEPGAMKFVVDCLHIGLAVAIRFDHTQKYHEPNMKLHLLIGCILIWLIICILLVLHKDLKRYWLCVEQKYLQSTTVREEQMRIRSQDAEQWMSHRLLPEDMKKRIRRYEQYNWQETRGVDEESVIRNLPRDLRRDIKRHLCLSLLMKVSASFFLSLPSASPISLRFSIWLVYMLF